MSPQVPIAGELAFTQPVGNCEGRWFGAEGSDGTIFLGFVYVDPQAGFTFEHYGDLEFADGKVRAVKSELHGKARLIVRITGNFGARCLTETQAVGLGLPPTPESMAFYKDDSPPGEHHAKWAYFHNHIGSSSIALDHVLKARAAGENSDDLLFEQAFALNALARFDETVTLLASMPTSGSTGGDLVAEFAYAHLKLGGFNEAIDLYKKAIELGSTRQWEFAANISAAYAALGDARNRELWAERSADYQSRLEKDAD